MLDLDKKKYPFSVTLGSTVSYKNLNKEELCITKIVKYNNKYSFMSIEEF